MVWCHLPVPDLACDIQKLYDKDPLGNVLVDKKRLEKTLLLSYVCNTQAGEQREGHVWPPPGATSPLHHAPFAEYQRGFHEMVMLFQLMVEHDHETFWLFQFFLQKTVRPRGSPGPSPSLGQLCLSSSPQTLQLGGGGVQEEALKWRRPWNVSVAARSGMAPSPGIALPKYSADPQPPKENPQPQPVLQGLLFALASQCFIQMWLETTQPCPVYPLLCPG